MAFNLIRESSSFISLHFNNNAGVNQEADFDLAPLVDIVFTLILFFMLTSPLITHWGIPINLPAARHITPVKQSEVEVAITADNRIVIGGRDYTLGASLEQELVRLAGTNQPVAIISDSAADFGTVLGVWDAAKEAQIKQLNIRARVLNTSRKQRTEDR